MATRFVLVLALVAGLAACGDVGDGVEAVAADRNAGQPADSADPTTGAGADADGDPPSADPTGSPARPSPDDAASPAGRDRDAAVLLPRTVAVVGDSLTLSADVQIEDALTRLGLDVLAIDAVESRRMREGNRSRPSGIDAIEALVAFDVEPDLWIIALGTNDVGAQVSTPAFRDDVASVLRRVPAGAPVIWVDLYVRDRDDAAREANEILRAVVGSRAASSVVDWYRQAEDPGVVTADGIHLTEIGRLRFAAAIAAGVNILFPI